MSHSHGAHDHSCHGHAHSKNEKKLATAAVLTGSFMIAEVVGGVISGSLALIADAGHMLTDFAALVLAWIALRLSRRPADSIRTYGFERFSVLAAFVNGLSLFVIAGWICVEAYERLTQPVEVLGGVMLWIAIAGFVVNILAFWMLTRGEGENLNVRAAALHVAGDLLGSIAAIIASIVIIYTGWTPIDPILSVFVAVIILRSAWMVIKESAQILLEAVPKGFDRDKVIKTLEQEVEGVVRVHHLHAWCINQERAMATLEVEVEAGTDRHKARERVKDILESSFAIGHATVEVEESSTQKEKSTPHQCRVL
ncbi:cation diffusion facilitator family transporter [Pleionea sp. CnH1-48]|uniref:cation diffusion facilitator family transporter n=1 Tax=Pleionea sp. CnH1-48 TaxID=2954494 RepID=UPI002097AEBB|nr:cation diffusion facilitator family transporter [Pleionea sp. CnH1-48]MCO7223146.1 cation diffusion facilitator family transporter [Pleionea sp. CnH1-48]